MMSTSDSDANTWQPTKPIDAMTLADVTDEIDRVAVLSMDPSFLRNISKCRRRATGTDPMNPPPLEPSEFERFQAHTVALQQRRLDLEEQQHQQDAGE